MRLGCWDAQARTARHERAVLHFLGRPAENLSDHHAPAASEFEKILADRQKGASVNQAAGTTQGRQVRRVRGASQDGGLAGAGRVLIIVWRCRSWRQSTANQYTLVACPSQGNADAAGRRKTQRMVWRLAESLRDLDRKSLRSGG